MALEMTIVPKSVELSTGVTLQYVEQGDTSGTPVVLVHGLTDSWRSFESVLPYLPASIHASSVTLRGHGDSEKPDRGYSPQDFTADIAAFMDAREIEAAIIVGHSLGTSIGEHFAADYPDRTLGLALIGALANVANNAALVEFWDTTVALLTDPVGVDVAREFQEGTLAVPISDDALNIAIQESLKVPAKVWRASLKSFFEIDVEGKLGRIAAPTLIVWGDHDAFCPRSDQELLVSRIPNARLLIYSGSGHALHWESPARFAGDLVKFVEEISG